jgi:hypothetical protein
MEQRLKKYLESACKYVLKVLAEALAAALADLLILFLMQQISNGHWSSL